MLLAAAALFACDRGAAPTAASPTAPGPTAARKPPEVAAMVNGRPITVAEVNLHVRSQGRPPAPGEKPSADQQRAALEPLIQQELEAQRAAELGLENDPDYVTELEKAEAVFKDARRRELAKLFKMKQSLDAIEVSEADQKAWFDANLARVQTEYHLQQIATRERAKIDAAAADLARGKPFEEVAAAVYGDQAGPTPWEVPSIGFERVLQPWVPELEKLQPGQVSGVIQLGEQFWLLKLIEKKQNPSVTFDVARQRIQLVLKAERYGKQKAQLETDLRGKAKIEVMLPQQ